MVNLEARIAVGMSFQRATEAGDVLGRFYELFISSDAEIEERFAHTDLDRQKEHLEISLKAALFSASGDHYARAELDRVRSSHGKKHLDIPARLYGLWLESLIRAVSEFDPEFSESMKAHWHSVLQPAIDHLTTED